MNLISKKVMNLIPPKFRGTTMIRMFGLLKVPMLFYIRPSVIKLDDNETIIKIKLNRRTKNHLNSMYFGALAAGADCAGGISAIKQIEESGENISLVFKDLHADFLKRAEGDTLFTCSQGKEIKDLIDRAIESKERENLLLNVVATTPDKFENVPVAKFTLTLSVKRY